MTLVVLEHDGARVSRASWEAVAAAQELTQGDGSLACVVLGHGLDAVAAEAAAAGVGAAVEAAAAQAALRL